MAERDYFPQRVNLHVPDMQYAAEVGENGIGEFSIGAPAAADAAAILNDQSIATAGSQTTLLLSELEGTYGRALTVKASGAATSNVTVIGRDYLNQPMKESFTLNGTTAVNGKKAFKYIDEVTFGATSATTIDLGTLDVFGLPFKAKVLLSSIQDGAVAGTAHTFVAGVATDPATATTGDPRGTIDPNSAADGSKVFGGIALFDKTNLHGVEQYFA